MTSEAKAIVCACYGEHQERFKNISEVLIEIKETNKIQNIEINRIDKVTGDTLASMKSFHKRLDTVEGDTKAILELSYSVRELAGKVGDMMENFQKQESSINTRFEKQEDVIDAKFEKQAEVIKGLATAQENIARVPGTLAINAWLFVFGIVASTALGAVVAMWFVR